MPANQVSPETKLLAAQLRAKDPKGIARVTSALKRKKGNVTHAAEALGVTRDALYKWARDIPEVAKLLEELGRGRVGPPAKKRGKKPAPTT